MEATAAALYIIFELNLTEIILDIGPLYAADKKAGFV